MPQPTLDECRAKLAQVKYRELGEQIAECTRRLRAALPLDEVIYAEHARRVQLEQLAFMQQEQRKAKATMRVPQPDEDYDWEIEQEWWDARDEEPQDDDLAGDFPNDDYDMTQEEIDDGLAF